MINEKCMDDDIKWITVILVLMVIAITILVLIIEFVAFTHPIRVIREALVVLTLSLFLKYICKGGNNE